MIIAERGEWHHDRMWRMRLQDQDVMAAARDKGIRRAIRSTRVILERNGRVSVFAKKGQTNQSVSGAEEDDENLENAGSRRVATSAKEKLGCQRWRGQVYARVWPRFWPNCDVSGLQNSISIENCA